MKNYTGIFCLLPVAYVIFGFLLIGQGLLWLGVFLFILSTLFGVLVFGIIMKNIR